MTDGQEDRTPVRRCAWCGEVVRGAKPMGRPKRYCKAGCRELAYRARREGRRIDAAVERALEGREPGS